MFLIMFKFLSLYYCSSEGYQLWISPPLLTLQLCWSIHDVCQLMHAVCSLTFHFKFSATDQIKTKSVTQTTYQSNTSSAVSMGHTTTSLPTTQQTPQPPSHQYIATQDTSSATETAKLKAAQMSEWPPQMK